MSTKESVTLFYSYAHEDEKLRDELAKHLSSLKREGVIKEWHDRCITPGDEWKHHIDHYLGTVELILLLISPDFINSDYCYDIEMQRAMERHKQGTARVVPIILRPVDWTKAPFASLQALPTDGKPVTEWLNQDSAFLNIAQGIRQTVEVFQPKLTKPIQRVKSASVSTDTAESTANTGPVIHGGIKVEKGDVVFGTKINKVNINPGKKSR